MERYLLIVKNAAFLLILFHCILPLNRLNAQDNSLKQAALAHGAEILFWDFEGVSIGKLPEGWKIEATGQKGPLASWQVQKDPAAPSGNKVLALVRTNHYSASTFNLCWTDRLTFLNGAIEVAFKPVSGRIDQGGGIMWRVLDKNNYYIARFNPLEDNFRIYYVKDGVRRMIESVRVYLDAKKWHLMKIVQHEDRFECFLNGRKCLEGKDRHLRTPGGVGLWTKADAVTSFDNFKIYKEN